MTPITFIADHKKAAEFCKEKNKTMRYSRMNTVYCVVDGPCDDFAVITTQDAREYNLNYSIEF